MDKKANPLQNQLLATLPSAIFEQLLPHLELVDMPLGKVLYESGDTLSHVYFPTDCIVSLLYVMENGASAEISVVGNEGMIGISLIKSFALASACSHDCLSCFRSSSVSSGKPSVSVSFFNCSSISS